MKQFPILLFAIGTITIACKEESQKKHIIHKPVHETIEVTLTDTIDPCCKMSVAKYTSDTSITNGKIYGFCSAMCKDAFKKDPTKYLVK